MLIKTINCGHFAERGFEIYPDDSRAPYVTDDFDIEGAIASTAMVLLKLTRNIQSSTPEEL